MYNTSWACHPAVGSIEVCMEKCHAYDKAMLFTTATEMASSFDMKGWMRVMVEHETLTDQVADAFHRLVSQYIFREARLCKNIFIWH